MTGIILIVYLLFMTPRPERFKKERGELMCFF